MKKFFTLSFLAFSFLASTSYAQFYIGAFGGLKSSGLKGAIKEATGGQVTVGSIADAGITSFSVGITTGYQVLPASVSDLYKLDVNLDASYSSFSYFEAGYNSVNGDGKFSAAGLSDGSTTVFSFDIMPIHRFNFSNFILSPFAGLGFGINLLMTSDTKIGPPSQTGTLTGTSQMNLGLLVFYGTIFNASSTFKPYVQFKHLIPFGDQVEFTENYQAGGGGGSQSYVLSISDVPNYFNFVAGVRFVF